MLKGVALKILSTLVFAFMMVIMKAHIDYPIGEVVFFRSAPALLVLFVWLLARGEFPRALKTKWLTGHLVRSLSGAASMSPREISMSSSSTTVTESPATASGTAKLPAPQNRSTIARPGAGEAASRTSATSSRLRARFT